MSKKTDTWTCCICGKEQKVKYMNGKPTILGMNNPWPLAFPSGAHCCDVCDQTKIIPIRLILMR